MASDLNLDVVIRLAIEGAKNSQSQLAQIGKMTDELNRKGQVTDKGWQDASKAIGQYSNATQKATRDTRGIYDSLSTVDQAMRRQSGTATRLANTTQQLGSSRKSLDHRSAIQSWDREFRSLERNQAASQRMSRSTADLSRQRKRIDNREATRAWNDQFRALERTTGAQDRLNDSTVRYASYDLANTMFTVAAGIAAVGTAFTVAAASQEKAFTEVERIVGGTTEQTGELKAELLDLSTQIPRSFENLSAVASLGAALDVPREALAEFTKTVAQFAAVTGVTEEMAATGFGRLSQYLQVNANEFENLGSSILKAGNISVATEEQVLKFSQALALPAARAGLAADQVVALGATIASFGNINVEGAGSALNRIFTNIDRNIDTGGAKMEAFAKYAGIAAEDFGQAWEEDAGSVFNDVIEGLSKDVGNLSGNLDDLGVRNVRDRRVIEALVLNYEQYRDILGETSDAYAEGSYMGEAYGMVLDDLASQWQIFINASMNAAAAIGGATLPMFADLLRTASDLLAAFADFASSPFGQFLTQILTPLAGMVAAVATLRGGLALGTASMIAFRQATQGIGITGITGQLKYLASGLFSLNPNIERAGTSLGTMATRSTLASKAMAGLRGVGRGLGTVLNGLLSVWGLLAVAAAAGLEAVRSAMRGTEADTKELANSIKTDLGGAFDVALQGTSITSFAGDVNLLRSSFESMTGQAYDLRSAFTLVNSTLDTRGWGILEDIDALLFGSNAAREGIENLGDALAGMGDAAAAETLNNMVSQFRLSNQEILQIINSSEAYRSKLVEVVDAQGRQVSEQELLNAAQQQGVYAADEHAAAQEEQKVAIDEATKALQLQQEELMNIGSESINAQSKIDSWRGSMNSLAKSAEEAGYNIKGTGDKALAFRDDVRQAEIGARDAALAMQENGASAEDVTKFYQNARNELVKNLTPAFDGNADAARAWADRVLGSSQEVIDQLFVTGSGVDDLNEKEAVPEVDLDDSKFQEQRRETEFDLRDLGRKEAEPSANLNTHKFNQRNRDVRHSMSILDRMRAHPHVNIQVRGAAHAEAVLNSLSRTRYAALYIQEHRLTDRSGNRPLNKGMFAHGGFTGRGHKFEAAGTVHRGEYVIPKEYVNQNTGLPYADALGKLAAGMEGRSSYAQGGYVAPPARMNETVALSAGSIQAIAHAVQPYLVLDSRVIAEGTSRQYERSTNIGAA